MLSCGRRENVSTTEEKKQENEEGRKNYGGGMDIWRGHSCSLCRISLIEE